MAHPEATRWRARQLFMGRMPLPAVARRVGVGLGTVKRWCREEEWGAMRRLHGELELRSAELAVAMAERARETADPQQAFAASTAAQLARQHSGARPMPTVQDIAKALVRVLAAHPEVGPVVKRNRGEVLRLVSDEAERLQGEAG
ncbi:MAG TPA: hypothetical protein VGC13_22340 [Longimicrobium sp.]|jgi:Sec-independent protein translocase protein TatA|uniref:hypothetical protein n=1 Tax=Longimicrobium sp. TaxID=2029185 RepID=UPI002EDB99E2